MNKQKEKVLFITWDGPQTTYMEGLFIPIFSAVQKQTTIEFHIVQFSWASSEKNASVASVAKSNGITYTHFTIFKKPNGVLGSIYTLLKGIRFLQAYIAKHSISIVLPRSTMPAVMINRLQLKGVKILFDADGLPLEERIDFAGLSSNSKQYIYLKREETKLLKKANGVITRSQKAIDIHCKTIGETHRNKFSVVLNGRDTAFFSPSNSAATDFRKVLGLPEDAFVFVYCGSLGPQYGWEEMVSVFKRYHAKQPNSKFLILSGNSQYALERIPADLADAFLVNNVPFEEVPRYLNVADVAFALRKPTFSMQGVAPIKLGEYLLMGLPTIAAKGIGDTDTILAQVPHCFLFDFEAPTAISQTIEYLTSVTKLSMQEAIRSSALIYFSIDNSALSYCKAFERL